MSNRTESLATARAEMIAARARLLAPVAGKTREELLAPGPGGS
jgi:hypothetical protein